MNNFLNHSIRRSACALLSLLLVCTMLFATPSELYAANAYYYVTVQHELDQCCSTNPSGSQTVFNGTSHTFALYTDGNALNGKDVKWSVTDTTEKGMGSGITATITESNNTGAVIKFEGTGSCFVTAKVKGSDSDSYYFSEATLDVCDAYYYADTPYLIVEHDKTYTLEPPFYKCTAEDPAGSPATVSDLNWEIYQNYTGDNSLVTLSNGQFKASRGEYLIRCYNDNYLGADCLFNIKVIDGTLKLDSKVNVPASTNATYKVTFNKNGGSTLSKTSKTVTSGKTYGTLPTAGRKNYTFKGWYTKKSGGTKITASTKVTLTANTTLYAQWSKVSAPGKAAITSLTNSKKGILAVKYKKVSGAAGYEICYSTSKTMKSAKKVTSTSLTKSISKLKKGRTYYVRVHAYKTDSLKNKVYGNYSSIKKITLKK